MTTSAKVRRQTLRKLLLSNQGGTQVELCQLLAAHGISTTQSTVSRDLKLLGAERRLRDDCTFTYILKRPNAGLPTKMIIRIEHNETQVVVRTGSGQAPAVGREIDNLNRPDILGTLAGNDTVVIIPASTHRVHEVAEALREFAEVDSRGPRPPPPPKQAMETLQHAQRAPQSQQAQHAQLPRQSHPPLGPTQHVQTIQQQHQATFYQAQPTAPAQHQPAQHQPAQHQPAQSPFPYQPHITGAAPPRGATRPFPPIGNHEQVVGRAGSQRPALLEQSRVVTPTTAPVAAPAPAYPGPPAAPLRGSNPAGTTPAGTTPAGTTPAGTTPAGTTPAGATPAGTTPAGTVPDPAVARSAASTAAVRGRHRDDDVTPNPARPEIAATRPRRDRVWT